MHEQHDGLTEREMSIIMQQTKSGLRNIARRAGSTTKAKASRNVHIREQNRQHAAEVRAQKKARRRQWDPPKFPKSLKVSAVHQDSLCLPSPTAECPEVAEDNALSSCPPESDPRGQTQDIVELLGPALLEDDEQRLIVKYKAARKSEGGADCGSIGSPTSAEYLAMQALTELTKPTVSPVPESALQLILARPSSERASLMITATQALPIVVSTRMQDANTQVVVLNAGRLTKPTQFDHECWIRSSSAQDTEFLTDIDPWMVLEWSRHWASCLDRLSSNVLVACTLAFLALSLSPIPPSTASSSSASTSSIQSSSSAAAPFRLFSSASRAALSSSRLGSGASSIMGPDAANASSFVAPAFLATS
ncbi:hypothetical protein B0H17DRAFT_1215422 [Mycena rosella]|uniref:Uncharacterized protein n=1 Tax=Mycena rosella TaxID=1033263 RepID=A0AAD7CHY0_MYCRO|nr:hypothetical protein B0H17DRAFT_1215422 [Mycena rosella]